MEAKDNKRYFIGVMIPSAKTFKEDLREIFQLAKEHGLAPIMYSIQTRTIATNRVVIQYVNGNCSLKKIRGKHFDAVFYFSERYKKALDASCEIRDDSYLDYILEKEGAVNHGRGM